MTRFEKRCWPALLSGGGGGAGVAGCRRRAAVHQWQLQPAAPQCNVAVYLLRTCLSLQRDYSRMSIIWDRKTSSMNRPTISPLLKLGAVECSGRLYEAAKSAKVMTWLETPSVDVSWLYTTSHQTHPFNWRKAKSLHPKTIEKILIIYRSNCVCLVTVCKLIILQNNTHITLQW